MVRALWSGASGMIAQQTNVDTIANNIANVNTVGYKTEQNEFKSLLYQEIQTKTTSANGVKKPVSSQVGLGVRNAAITSEFSQGAFQTSESQTSFAISGDGFFGVVNNGVTYYTRNGDFHWSIGNNANELVLCTSDGCPVIGTNGQEIRITGDNFMASRITVDATGQLMYPDANNNPTTTPAGLQPNPLPQIQVYQFQNPSGLYKAGSTLFSATDSSGAAIQEVLNGANNPAVKRSEIYQGYLESSNVQVADEMVNLIIAQRAYELNSKAITTADSMLQVANELKR